MGPPEPAEMLGNPSNHHPSLDNRNLFRDATGNAEDRTGLEDPKAGDLERLVLFVGLLDQ